VAALDELFVRELAAHDNLQTVAEEKRLLEQELRSIWTMFTERDHSSSEVISLVVAHVVALLNNYVPDLDPELLRKDYQ
jgi:hypothetical protein